VTAGLWWLVDAMLILTLSVLAAGAVGSRSLRRAVVLFIAFGLVTALIWARLAAPDVALAEAAIGAGLTGALLLAALRDMPPEQAVDTTRPGLGVELLVSAGSIGVAALFGWAVWSAFAGAPAERLDLVVARAMPESGVVNPVTGVLLNFRAYDTLLELAVLAAALLGILALGPARRGFVPGDAVLQRVAGWLVPLLILVAGYLLWVGAKAPGGAFQAGALLAAAGVVVHLIGNDDAGLPTGRLLRLLAAAGVGVFTLVGLATLHFGGAFLAYRGDTAGLLILAIEVFATLGIAITLVIAYLGGESASWSGGRRARETRP